MSAARSRNASSSALAAGLALLALLFASGSCAANKGAPPDWIDTRPAREGEAVLGYGCAQPEISNRFFKKMTADERARAELAREIDRMAMDALDGDSAGARDAVEEALPAHGVTDRWLADDGTLCSRAEIERAVIEKAINGARREGH